MRELLTIGQKEDDVGLVGPLRAGCIAAASHQQKRRRDMSRSTEGREHIYPCASRLATVIFTRRMADSSSKLATVATVASLQ